MIFFYDGYLQIVLNYEADKLYEFCPSINRNTLIERNGLRIDILEFSIGVYFYFIFHIYIFYITIKHSSLAI